MEYDRDCWRFGNFHADPSIEIATGNGILKEKTKPQLH